MENASDGCVRNQGENFKTLSKLAADDLKAKHANPYVNKPIFRRKLIEKYSTARYNINTKRVLVKISPASLSWANNETHKLAHENNSKNASVEKNVPVSSVIASAPTITRTSRRSINAESSTRNFKSNVSPSSSRIKLYEKPDSLSCSRPIPNESSGVCATNLNHSPNVRKRKLDSTASSPATNGTWKIAPKSIYNHLLDMCQTIVEIKPEELKKETAKKRKICHWSKKRSRKKPSWCQKTVANRCHFDPYIECLKEAENNSKCTSAGTDGDKLGIVMYLGVNRPVFPLVYRNLRVLNDSNDEKITDFWAEFALSTLITKYEDSKCKPVLVPIKDAELAALASECVEATVVRSETSHISSAISASNEDVTITSQDTPRVCIKREENHVIENDSKFELRSLESDAKPYKPRNKKSIKRFDTKKRKLDDKAADNVEREFDKTVEQNESTNLERNEEENERKPEMAEIERKSKAEEEAKRKSILGDIKRKFEMEEIERKRELEEIERNSKIEEIKRKSKMLESELKVKFEESERKSKMEENQPCPKVDANRRKPTAKFLEYQAENLVRVKRTPKAGPKSKSRSRPSSTGTNRPKEDEKSILKKFGYKECFVAIPKLSDTLIKYLSSGNYSNQSAELSDPTERELIEDTDDFGLIQCTRTDGIIIDYVKRNRSSVYFYKLKKMLDFQKTNNKYFVCCDYILIDCTENDRDVDIESIEEGEVDYGDGNQEDSKKDVKPLATFGVRSSKNPNDLFKVSKLSEFKDKSNNISWVKNHDLKLENDSKWLLLSLDKFVASLSHVGGCVLRYRLLFEILYRAELSKKVICCQMTELPEVSGSGNKLAFGVYAFPGLCDKLLVGPYSNHEQHQLSAFVRSDTGSSLEPALIRTPNEKEDLARQDDSCPSVKHINAKWWSGKRSSDLTEQYLNFYFNPSVVKCVQSTDKINLARIIDDHPCYNYHSYEITGRESNLVLFHDRTNAFEKNATARATATISASKTPTNVDIVNNACNTTKEPLSTAPLKQSRNLRKKPRMDYSQLVTDDMAIPIRAKNWNFNIVDVKSLRKRSGSRAAAKNEGKPKIKRNRYHEAPQQHIMNERLRRLEFRNRRNNLASVLEARPTPSGNPQSLVSILQQAREIITYLNVDNERLDEEGKRLRTEQSIMMRKFLALLRSLDINSTAYKNGMNFVASWKKIKANHRNRLIEILGQNFDKYKANKAAELSRIAASASEKRVPNIIRPIQRYGPNFQRVILENQSDVEGDKNELRERDSRHVENEDTAQRMSYRKRKRQKLRDVFRKRNILHQKKDEEVVECEISEEVIGEDGTSSDRLRGDVGEVSILVPNMASGGDPYAVDPLAEADDDDDDDDDDDAASSLGVCSTQPRKEPSHPLYYEHSYSCIEEKSIDLTKELVQRTPGIAPRGRPMKRTEPTFAFLNRNRLNIVRNLAGSSLQQQRRNPILSPMSPNSVNVLATSSQQRKTPILVTRPPIFKNLTSSSPQRRNQPIRTSSSPSPAFQIVVRRTANENLCIDIIDNGRVFARLNIAKVSDGNNDARNGADSSGGVGDAAGGATTYTKIMTIIQRFLHQMEKTSPVFTANQVNDDERSKQAKRRHVVNSLRSFISKFENRRKVGDDAGYSSSSRASNSDNTSPSPPYVADNIDLDDGYSSKSSEASYDRDQDANAGEGEAVTELEAETETITVSSDCPINGGLSIENIVLDDDSDERSEIIPADEFIAEEDEEEEEEEEIVCEEELIEEEEEEEEIVGEGNTLEEMNDVVDAAMRGDDGDRFANTGTPDATPSADEEPVVRRTKTLVLPKPSSRMLYTNQFTIIRSKNKFIPNIMKMPTKVADVASASKPTSDYLSRIQIKPSVGSLVKLSTSNLQLTTNEVDDVTPPGNYNNESIIKRLWYSPVTRAESDVKVVRRESNFNEAAKTDDPQSEKLPIGEHDSKNSQREDSNSETESGAEVEHDNNGSNRIVIKSFANHNKFQEAFLSNVDKLLNPES